MLRGLRVSFHLCVGVLKSRSRRAWRKPAFRLDIFLHGFYDAWLCILLCACEVCHFFGFVSESQRCEGLEAHPTREVQFSRLGAFAMAIGTPWCEPQPSSIETNIQRISSRRSSVHQYGGEDDIWGIGGVLGRPTLNVNSHLHHLQKFWSIYGSPNLDAEKGLLSQDSAADPAKSVFGFGRRCALAGTVVL